MQNKSIADTTLLALQSEMEANWHKSLSPLENYKNCQRRLMAVIPSSAPAASAIQDVKLMVPLLKPMPNLIFPEILRIKVIGSLSDIEEFLVKTEELDKTDNEFVLIEREKSSSMKEIENIMGKLIKRIKEGTIL